MVNGSSSLESQATFDLTNQAGVAHVLSSVRASNLTPAQKNELRDLVFLYVNGGKDESVRLSLLEKLASNKVVPIIPAAKKQSEIEQPLTPPVIPPPFGGTRPAPTFTEVHKKEPISQVQVLNTDLPAEKQAATVSESVLPEPVEQDSLPSQSEARQQDESVTQFFPVAVTNKVEPPNSSVVVDVKNENSVLPETASIQSGDSSLVQTPASSPINSDTALQRIREIKNLVNMKVGNPVNLVDIDNQVGREYMSALLEAMKKLNSGSSVAAAMDRLEKAYIEVEMTLEKHSTVGKDVAANPTVVSGEAIVPPISEAPSPQAKPFPYSDTYHSVAESKPEPVPKELSKSEEPIPVNDVVATTALSGIKESSVMMSVPPVPNASAAKEPTEQVSFTPHIAPAVSKRNTDEKLSDIPQSDPVSSLNVPSVVDVDRLSVVPPAPAVLPDFSTIEKKPDVSPSVPSEKTETEPVLESDTKSVVQNGRQSMLSQAQPIPDVIPIAKPKTQPLSSDPFASPASAPIQPAKTQESKSAHPVTLNQPRHHNVQISKPVVSNPDDKLSIKVDPVAKQQSPSAGVQTAVSITQSGIRLRNPNELATPIENDPNADFELLLRTKEVDNGLQQLLEEWSIFKKSGLFGTGPKGREHPLFLKLASLQIPLILAGRFEGATQEIRQSVTDYMNGWRYEQGIIYEQGETFEHYLRRVIRHILDLQTD